MSNLQVTNKNLITTKKKTVKKGKKSRKAGGKKSVNGVRVIQIEDSRSRTPMLMQTNRQQKSGLL